MAAANNASTLGEQLEKVRPDLQTLFQLDPTLFTRIMARPSDTVSTRPERIPFEALSGGKSRALNLDGGDMGRGGGPQIAVGTLSPVYFGFALEWTKLAEIATNSKEKAIASYAKQILKNGMAQFKSNLDSLISYGDGANTLGTVTAWDGTNFIATVDNANRFYDGQDIDNWTAIGGTNRGTLTILSVDANNKQIYFSGSPALGTAANDLLLENGSSGAANSGVNGISSLQVNSNVGTYMGVTRSNYPGKFSTPTVSAGGATLSPAIARLLLNQLKIAMGADITATDDYIFYMGLDQQAAWENTGIVVTQNIQNGDATARDMLAKKQITTIGGIEIVPSLKAIPGRVDLLAMKHFFRTEIQPIDYYEAGGQTVFPPYAASGGIAAAYMTYLIWGGNIGSNNPRAGAFISNLAIPSGY